MFSKIESVVCISIHLIFIKKKNEGIRSKECIFFHNWNDEYFLTRWDKLICVSVSVLFIAYMLIVAWIISVNPFVYLLAGPTGEWARTGTGKPSRTEDSKTLRQRKGV